MINNFGYLCLINCIWVNKQAGEEIGQLLAAYLYMLTDISCATATEQKSPCI